MSAAAEDGDVFVPRAEVPAPALAATVPLPVAVSHGAAALGAAHHTFILAGDADGAVELVVVVVDAAFAAPAVGRLRIDRARLIAGCDPCVHVDAEGLTRVALLFAATGEATPRVGLARLAFDGAARPVFVDGVERRRLLELETPPIGGALIVTDLDAWSLAWCVHMAGGRLVGGVSDQPARTAALTASGARVLFVLAAEMRLAVAFTSDAGDVDFVSL